MLYKYFSINFPLLCLDSLIGKFENYCKNFIIILAKLFQETYLPADKEILLATLISVGLACAGTWVANIFTNTNKTRTIST